VSLASVPTRRARRSPVASGAGRVAILWLAIGLAAAIVVACSSGPSTPGPDPGRSVISVSSGRPTDGPQTVGPPPSPTPPDDTDPVVIDAELLAFLPDAIDGVPVQEDIDEAATALNDPGLARIASALDAAVAVSGDNLVLAWVVRLRPDQFTADTYRQWRDSYDDGACAAAGGVVGHAESEIAGRTAFVTSCAAGLHTYHVWLEVPRILISASSLGQARFGEKLLGALRVPE
jgi:hypothetical protein